MNPEVPDSPQQDTDPQAQDDSGRKTLVFTSDDADEATREYASEDEHRRLEMLEIGDAIAEGNVVLRIAVQGAGTPLLLPLFDEAVIGRRNPDNDSSPDLDLTPYGAYQMGISRHHALFKLHDNVPVLIDLASRNGTFLNGRKLSAHQPAPIRDGDTVRLGKITMTISIEVEPLE